MKAAVLHGYDEALAGETFVTYEDVADPKIAAPTYCRRCVAWFGGGRISPYNGT